MREGSKDHFSNAFHRSLAPILMLRFGFTDEQTETSNFLLTSRNPLSLFFPIDHSFAVVAPKL